MSHNRKLSSRLGTLAMVMMVGVAIPACSSNDGTTAPDVNEVSARPAAQTPRAATFTFATAPGVTSAISSDGAGANYRDAVCGVTARVFFASPNYLDGNLQLDNPRASDRKCVSFGAAAYPRKLTILYPDNAVSQTNTGGMNVDDLGTVTEGTSGLRSMNVRIEGSVRRCASLGFGNASGGSQVLVTRLSPTSWGVSSQTGGAAACTSPAGAVTTIPNFAVSFTVTLN